jgi:hypothetical protein
MDDDSKQESGLDLRIALMRYYASLADDGQVDPHRMLHFADAGISCIESLVGSYSPYDARLPIDEPIDHADILTVLLPYYPTTKVPTQMHNALRRKGIDTLQDLLIYVDTGVLKKPEFMGDARIGYHEGKGNIRELSLPMFGPVLSVALFTYLNEKGINLFADGYRPQELKQRL